MIRSEEVSVWLGTWRGLARVQAELRGRNRTHIPGDGDLDLALANCLSDEVSVLLNQLIPQDLRNYELPITNYEPGPRARFVHSGS